MFIRFRQWVAHVMDHHWRRRTVKLRKRQNVAAWEAKGGCRTCNYDDPCECP